LLVTSSWPMSDSSLIQVVGARGHLAIRTDHRAQRIGPRVGPVAAGQHATANDRGGAPLMLHRGRQHVHVLVELVVGVAVVAVGGRIHGHANRALAGGGDEGKAVVRDVAVALHERLQRHFGRRADAEAKRRCDTVVVVLGHVARRLHRLPEGRHAEGRAVGQLPVQVGGRAVVVVGAGRQAHLAAVMQAGLLADLVDHAAGGAAAEEHRRRALEHLHRLQREDIAAVLAAVAHAVEVDVGAGREAAQVDVVADHAALAGAQGDAGHVAQRVLQRGGRLRVEHLAVQHGDGLRHVAQGGLELATGAGLAVVSLWRGRGLNGRQGLFGG
jgi:hypothetical protein